MSVETILLNARIAVLEAKVEELTRRIEQLSGCSTDPFPMRYEPVIRVDPLPTVVRTICSAQPSAPSLTA